MKKLYALKAEYNGSNFIKELIEFDSIEEFEKETSEWAGDFFDDYEEIEGKIFVVYYEDTEEGNGYEDGYLTLEEAIKDLEIGKEIKTYWGQVTTQWVKIEKERENRMETKTTEKIEIQIQFNEREEGDNIVECEPYWITFSENVKPVDGEYGYGYYVFELFAPFDAPKRKVKITTVETVEVIEE